MKTLKYFTGLLAAIATLAGAAFAAGPTLVKDIVPGVTSSSPSLLTNVNGTLFFTVGSDLWRSDGTSAGTVPLSIGVAPNSMVNNNGVLLFIVNTGFSNLGAGQLWKSDGTAAGTVPVVNVTASYEGFLISGEPMLSINGKVYLNGTDNGNGKELWKTDGTVNGTGIVQDINPGLVYTNPPDQFTNVQGTLFFTADDNVHGHAIWKTDGTPGGTQLVLWGAGVAPVNLTNVGGGELYTPRSTMVLPMLMELLYIRLKMALTRWFINSPI